MMSPMVGSRGSRRAGASVSVRALHDAGFVSRTICSQKSTNTGVLEDVWSNMYSAASPRFTIHSPSGGVLTP
jgi:hypothetical protein